MKIPNEYQVIARGQRAIDLCLMDETNRLFVLEGQLNEPVEKEISVETALAILRRDPGAVYAKRKVTLVLHQR